MELLPGFRMRPPQDEDPLKVAAFSNEECVLFIGVPVIDADWLRSRWMAPAVDRDLDFAVVESPSGEPGGSRRSPTGARACSFTTGRWPTSRECPRS